MVSKWSQKWYYAIRKANCGLWMLLFPRMAKLLSPRGGWISRRRTGLASMTSAYLSLSFVEEDDLAEKYRCEFSVQRKTKSPGTQQGGNWKCWGTGSKISLSCSFRRSSSYWYQLWRNVRLSNLTNSDICIYTFTRTHITEGRMLIRTGGEGMWCSFELYRPVFFSRNMCGLFGATSEFHLQGKNNVNELRRTDNSKVLSNFYSNQFSPWSKFQ